MVEDEAIVCLEHVAGEIFGDRLGSEKMILTHFIRKASTQELDDVSVYIGHKVVHGHNSTE